MNAEDLAGVDFERDVVDGAQEPGRSREGLNGVAEADDRRCGRSYSVLVLVELLYVAT